MCGHISQVDSNYKSIYFNKIIIPYLAIHNIHVPKHDIISNITSGTSYIMEILFLYKNYKCLFILEILLLLLIIYGYFTTSYLTTGLPSLW